MSTEEVEKKSAAEPTAPTALQPAKPRRKALSWRPGAGIRAATARTRGYFDPHHVPVLPPRVSHSKRARRALLAAFVGLLIVGSWYWVIPRVDVTLKAQYHEGVLNTIAVDARVLNDGTLPLAPFHIEVVVRDLSTNASVGHLSRNASVAPHGALDLDPIQFKGDQLTTNYTISIFLSFETSQGRVVKTFDFRTEEPYMNLYYDARVA